MICKNCNTPNEDNAKFCRYCGAALEEQKIKKAETKKNTVIGIAAAVIVILLALIISVVMVTRTSDEKKQEEYNQYVSQGDKYLEELDYEKAEDSYLNAIKLDPKQEETYLALADLYLTQEDFDKALDILKQAEKNTAHKGSQSSGKTNAIKDKKDQVEQKKTEAEIVDKLKWAVKPEIEADDIYYLYGYNGWEEPENLANKQMISDYAVIKKGDIYGLIDDDGKWYQDLQCTKITTIVGYYDMETKDAMYSAEYDMDTDQFYLDDNDELQASVAMVGDVYGAQGEYYYCDGLCNTAVAYMGSAVEWELKPLEETAPVQETSEVYEEGDWSDENWFDENGKKYAVWKDGNPVTDYIYDECGSLESGLMAAKKDGRWGYIDENGKTVIPFEYDASWQHYTSEYPNLDSGEYCYAATEGYVPLVKDGKWEMRDTENNVVIPSGAFEEILPVHNGKCWVKKDGKWGVIQIADDTKKSEDQEDKDDKKEETVDANTYMVAYGPILDQIAENAPDPSFIYNIYWIYDIDKDGVKELLAQQGNCEADYMYDIYTIENGTAKYLGQISGDHTSFHESENGGADPYIIRVNGHMGYEALYYVSIVNGEIRTELISQRELEPGEMYYDASAELPYAEITDKSLLSQ